MKYTKEILQEAVQASKSFLDVLKYFGFERCAGGTYGHIKSRIRLYQIDTSHFTGKRSQIGLAKPERLTPDQVLVRRTAGPRTESTLLRRAMIESGLSYQCSSCECGPVWCGKPLKIQIDHKDGDWRNNLRENVRFLCPNCHSQTSTHSVVKNKSALQTSKRERPLPGPYCPEKIIWPSKDELSQLIQESPVRTVASKLGVSDKAVKKRCVKLGILTRGPGQWTKDIINRASERLRWSAGLPSHAAPVQIGSLAPQG